MRRKALPRPTAVLALLGLALGGAVGAAAWPAKTPAAPRPSADAVASLPLSFEPAGDAGFASRGPGYSLALTPSGAVVAVGGGSFQLRPTGAMANPAARLVAREPLGATVSHLEGDDPARWRINVPTYGRVEARQVWPGVDVVWHGDQRRLQHDMVVAPGVDPAVVAFDVEGTTSLALDPNGDLVIGLGATKARLARPVLYQDVDGRRRRVAGGFTLLNPSRIGFHVGEYDESRPLVIDPTLVTSTLLGGGGNDSGFGIAVDAQGNTYVTGSTESADFPSMAPLQSAPANAGGAPTSDVFVSKLSPDGRRLLWSTYLGGSGRDTGYAIAVGSDGAVYVAGVTESSDFPRRSGAQEAYAGGPSDAFAAKIAADGTTLQWSTFLGGAETDRARGLAVDASGNAFVTGSTNSVDFPAVNAYQPGPFRPDDVDAFLVKVPSAGGPFASATRLGGSNDDRGLAVAVDGGGNAYLTGDTLSPGFPTVRPIQPGSGGSPGGVAGSFPDAFVAKFDPTGSALVYSTFLGGSDVDQGTAIAVDSQGGAYVAGNTNSPNFPTAAPAQARKDDDADAFVTKLDAAGAALVYSTYAGGSGADGANAIAVDRSGNAHVAGTTGSANWPTNRPVQAARGGGEDAFVITLDAGGRVAFSTFFGGRDADAGMGIALDGQGAVRVLGLTSSTDFPSLRPVEGSKPAGGDAFVATLNLADTTTPPTNQAGAPTATSSDEGHDRRVRALGILTLALLLAAVAQTLYLRRRPVPATRPSPSPTPPAPTPTAASGLKVLGETGRRTAAASEPVKAAASKSTRTPKMRGGPKTGPQKTAPGRQKPGTPDTPVADESWPTVVEPAPPKPKRQEPVITQLLEEDLWAPEPPADAPDTVAGEPEPAVPALDDRAPPEPNAEAATTAAPPPPEPSPRQPSPREAAPRQPSPRQPSPRQPSPEPAPEPAPDQSGPEPAPAIPPVPASELSFWDLFPEDLPPARPSTAPVDDVLVDHLALPEGPDSNVARIIPAGPDEGDRPVDMVSGDPPDDLPPPPPSAPPPPEAEIVIAELLDGPPPAGLRASPDVQWAPTPGDDFVLSDLLADGDGEERDDDGPQANGDEAGADEARPPGRPPLSRQEQARIAADRARRRRARRSGRRKRPGSG